MKSIITEVTLSLNKYGFALGFFFLSGMYVHTTKISKGEEEKKEA